MELDKNIDKPIYTREAAKKYGLTPERIEEIFGANKSVSILSALAKAIYYVTFRR